MDRQVALALIGKCISGEELNVSQNGAMEDDVKEETLKVFRDLRKYVLENFEYNESTKI